MKNNRFKFNQDTVAARQPNPEKRVYFYDTEEKGMGLAITSKGTKTFFYHGRVNGRSERVPAGRFPEISVDKAKKNILLIRTAIEEGRDPRQAVAVARRRRGSGAVTLADFWKVYEEEYGKDKRAKWKEDDRAFELYFGPLADLPLETITPDRVRVWHRALGKKAGEPTANKMANLLRAVFTKAMIWVREDGRHFALLNPAAAQLVERFEEAQRDRFLQDHELPRFFKALTAHETPGARHFFQLALYTGQRKDNIKTMKFEDVDFENLIWTIPREEFKGKKGKKHPHPVPLITQAAWILNIRREMLRSGWVFPGRRANGKPIGNVDFWFAQIKTAAHIPDIRIHDLRRSTASWMAMTESSYPIIAQLLGHSLPGATSIYARLSVEPVRDALQVAVDKMLEVAGVE